MLYAFGIINDEFEVSGEDEKEIAQKIDNNLSRQHLREYCRAYYRKGLYLVKAKNLPEATKIAHKLTPKQKRIFMPDLPLWQGSNEHNTEVAPCPSSDIR